MDRDEELRKLIMEQKEDEKYGKRVWPEFSRTSSLDAMHAVGIDLDQDGHIIVRNRNYSRMAPRKTKRAAPKPKRDCTKHPGEMLSRKDNGWRYCRGCDRDTRRARLGYVKVKRRKVDGPRTKEDVKKAKRKYTKRTKEQIAAYQREYYIRNREKALAYAKRRRVERLEAKRLSKEAKS